jgi:hypothetical protein
VPDNPLARKLRLALGQRASIVGAPAGLVVALQPLPENLEIIDHLEGPFDKGTSKIQTDLTRDRGWDVVGQADLKWVNLVSVNEIWSAFSTVASRSRNTGAACTAATLTIPWCMLQRSLPHFLASRSM